MTVWKLFIFLTYFAASSPLVAQTFAYSKQSFVGLLESRGPESLALGGALAAFAQDVTALDENPAGLAESQGMEAGLGHSMTLQDSALELAQFSRAIQGFGGIGIKFKYLNLGTFEKRDDYGQLLPDTFQPFGFEGLVGAGYKLNSRLDLGISLGYLQQSIAGQAQQGFDLNLGGLWQASQAWRLAAGVKGLGGGAGENPMPSTGYVGAVFQQALSQEMELLWTGQLNIGFSGPSSLGLGGQLGWRKIYLRGGYYYPFEEATLAGLQGLGAGLGASLYAFSLDYGITFQGELGTIQAVTISYHWNTQTVAETVTKNLQYLAKNPKDKRVWMETGKLYLHFNRKADAASCFKWAVSIDPADEEAKRLLEETSR